MRYAIFSILALAFLVTACGGEPGATGTDTTTTTPDAAGGDGDAAPAPSTGSNEGGAEDEFERALSGFMTGSFMVAYDITMTNEGETLTMATTQYFDGPERMRTDATAMGTETRTYIMGDEFVTCFRQDGEWSCMLLSSGEESGEESESPDAFSDLTNYAESDEDALEYTVSSDGTMRIVGVTAECFRIASVENTARYCIHDGVPLYMSAEDEMGSYEMKATNYRKGVSGSDFEYPAEPSEGFGGMMGGFGEDFNAEDFENMDWGEFDPSMYE